MKRIVYIKVKVDAPDAETAIRRAMFRLKEVRPTDVIEDKHADIDLRVETPELV
jgi:hypothetical protein